jgi:hypothetical protein
MISAEAPIIFAKACEIFILELTLRAWIQTEDNKRRTLQRSDVANAIAKNDTFDFLIDIVPRDDIKLGGGNNMKKDDLSTMLFRTPYLSDPMAMSYYSGMMATAGGPANYPPPTATVDQQQFMMIQQQQQQQLQQQQLQHYLLSQQQQLQPSSIAPLQQHVVQTGISLPFGTLSNQSNAGAAQLPPTDPSLVGRSEDHRVDASSRSTPTLQEH